MSSASKIVPEHLRLNITLRIEAGCLGPKGDSLLDDFCKVAQKQFDNIRPHFINWKVLPRRDKSLPEIQFQIEQRNLNRHQTNSYLKSFDEDVDKFEDYISEVIAFSVNVFLMDHTS